MQTQAGRLCFPASIKRKLASGDWHIIVTGAGGWFGLATLEMLEDALGPEFEHRVDAFAQSERAVVMRSGRAIKLKALHDIAHVPARKGLLIAHYAFLTREKEAAIGKAAYVDTNRSIISFLEQQATRLRPVGTFSTSSGAVYNRTTGGLVADLDEHAYGVLKLEEEAVFEQLRERQCRSAVCRVFNVSGAFINKDYALSSLIGRAMSDKEIAIDARRLVNRSYAHVSEIVATGFAIMIGAVADPAQSYDTAGDEIVEVGELAVRIRTVLGCPEKTIVRAPLLALPEDRYVGRLQPFGSLSTAAGAGLASLDMQIADTPRFISRDPLSWSA